MRLCSELRRCSCQICPVDLKGLSTPAPYPALCFSIYWTDQYRLWNGIRKCSQNSALSALRSFPIEVRLALSNSMKSTKLGTEEARWECFIIWWRKIWALGSVFHTMTTQCSCWVVWQHKTTEAVWNRGELYFEVIDETHCFNCSNEKDSSEIVLVSHICSRSAAYYMVCLFLR